MTRTVLIIEDEHKIAQWVQTYFEQAGFATLLAADGKTGLMLAQTKTPDLVILDLNLPGLDGLDVCRAIRGDKTAVVAQVPIIMLTARVEETDRLIGLELGADDYVTKPFSPRELVARARALFRRLDRYAEAPQTIQDGDLLVEVDAHHVSLGGAALDLTPNQFAVLVALLENRGRVLSRAQLIELALGHDYEGLERSVDVYIRQLRRKIETDPANPQRIQTVFGVGYRYV
ncbi:MAG: response regulator transcription factor [Ardenticatenaceae bacterium]|nr:response regulator transcription factor [Ardenticatenaceae bacterium]